MHDDYLDGNLLFTYNKLNSLTKKVIDITTDNGGFYQEIDYTYETIANTQSDRIEELKVTIGNTETIYTYEYDLNGNITKVYSGNLLVYQYAYDNLGQLVREDNYYLNKSYVYIYDDAGNMTTKDEYAFTTGTLGSRRSRRQFTYTNAEWGDQLVGYNGTYYWVDYDEIGNPVRYGYGESDSDYMEDGYELTWDGRELVAFRQCSDFDSLTYVSEITYTYNADGIRTSKTVNGIKHEYYLSGSQILAEVWEENNVEHMLIYIYDESGSPIGLKYRNDAYNYDAFDCFFFEKNIQGDIVAVYNESGTRIGQYKYNAWGNHTVSVTSAVTTFERQIVNSYNPFRYRGYYYDVETGFYYLQSRYYNPEWCRFLNADVYVSTGQGLLGNNMYAYCNNNPIMFVDHTGKLFDIIFDTRPRPREVGRNPIYQYGKTIVEDIRQITSGNVKATVTNEGVRIENSHKIRTPLVQFMYSVYVNHINPDTREKISGTTAGVFYEWLLHNLQYRLATNQEDKKSSSHLDLGKTIFSDDHSEGRNSWKSKAMKITYMLLFPIPAVYDIYVNGGANLD